MGWDQRVAPPPYLMDETPKFNNQGVCASSVIRGVGYIQKDCRRFCVILLILSIMKHAYF